MERNDDSRILIFNAVITRLLESVAPHIFLIISEFENENQIQSLNQEKVDEKLEELFEIFPRKVPLYKEIIEELKKLASPSVVEIIHLLTKIIKEVLNDNCPVQFQIIQSISPQYDPSIRHQHIILYYFAMFLTSDLICQIVAHEVSREMPQKQFKNAIPFLTRTGYNIALTKPKLKSTGTTILKQWSIIFSLVSEHYLNDVAQIFQLFSKETDISRPFCLMRYLRHDLDDSYARPIFEDVIHRIKKLYKKKMLTDELLESLSHMLVTMPYYEDLFLKLFNIIHPLRKDKFLWKGANVLLTTLIQFIPNKLLVWHRLHKFFQKRILTQISENEKLPVLLQCFEIFIIGKKRKPTSEIWEWGKNPRSQRFSYIKLYSERKETEGSFLSIFMNNFYPKCDFSICPKYFKQVLLHLASIDFQKFVNSFVLNTVKLDYEDPRFIVLLILIPSINTTEFISNAYRPITKKMIDDLNQMLRPSILKTLNKYRNQFTNSHHAVCVKEYDILMESLTLESDQKISQVLDEWKITKFTETIKKHNRSVHLKEKNTLLGRLLRVLKFTLTNDDFADPLIIDLLVELSCNENDYISSTAYSICTNIIQNLPNVSDYLSVLMIGAAADRDSESIFISLSLINSALNHLNEELDENLLYELEIFCFFCICSIYPATRNLVMMILNTINQLLNNKGLVGYCHRRLSSIEHNVKSRILIYNKDMDEHPETIVNTPSSVISLETAILSHYCEIWLFFIAESMNTLIELNYTPVLKRIRNIRKTYVKLLLDDSEKNCNLEFVGTSVVGILIMILDSMFYQPGLIQASKSMNSEKQIKIDLTYQFEEFETNPIDLRSEVCDIVYNFLHSDSDSVAQIAFSALPHLHFSLLGPLIDVIAQVPAERIFNASYSLSLIVRLPDIDKSFFIHNFRRFISFLNTMHYSLLKSSLNGPRMINWDTQNQNVLSLSSTHLKNYCIIIITIFKSYKNCLTESDWPLNTREIGFRFLINWAVTTNPNLKTLRIYAQLALATLVKIGPFFSDSLFFDNTALELFGNMEQNALCVLKYLLDFHFDILIEIFITACFTRPNIQSDLYFDAIVQSINSDHIDTIMNNIGPILFLFHVYFQKEHPKSKSLIVNLLSICDIENIPYTDEVKLQAKDPLNLPSIFSYATEAVFHSFFEVLNLEGITIPFKYLIEAIRPWFSQVRLLPNQKMCSPLILSQFHYYTPYNFLTSLLDATKKINEDQSCNEDQFHLMTSLWLDLVKYPDNFEIVPLFLSSHFDQESTFKMFTTIVDIYPKKSLENIIQTCSFSFFYYVVHNLNETFENRDKWIISFLINIAQRNWEILYEYIPKIIHFVFLFRKKSTFLLFEIICHKMNLEYTENSLIITESFREVIDKIMSKMSENDIIEWGNESLKWFFGCSDIEIATTSLCIYNRINKPSLDQNILKSIIKTIAYHIDQVACTNYSSKELTSSNPIISSSSSITSLVSWSSENINNIKANDLIRILKNLIKESFILMNNNFPSNEILILNYAMSFLDCSIFFESENKESMMIFLQSLKFPEMLLKIQGNIISLIRPIIPILEANETARKMIEMIFSKTQNDELLMIIAPIKKPFPQFFPNIPVSMFFKTSTNRIPSKASHNTGLCSPSSLTFDETFFDSLSENGLSAGLGHYSMMIDSASRPVVDAIFEISTLIVKKVQVNDNNQLPLAKLFQIALRFINRSKNALNFVQVVNEFCPYISTINIINVFSWDRPLGDVSRSIKSLITVNDDTSNYSSISDFKSISSTQNLLFVKTPPKVIPFSTQYDILECMKNIDDSKPTKKHHKKRKSSSRKKLQTSIPNSVSVVFNIPEYAKVQNLRPLIHPKRLILDKITSTSD